MALSGEVMDWKGQSSQDLKAIKDNLERLKQLGIEAIEDWAWFSI
ncbi:MAG: hypothetical protein Kow00121_50130 [Elainellaceae cyanobacterium]